VSVDLKEKAVALLSTTTISFAADDDTILYTVPAGKRCVLSHAVIVAADADTGSTITIGQSGATTDFLAANTLSNIAAQYDAVVVRPIPNTTPLKSKSYAAATVIKATVASNGGAAGGTLYLFGFLY